MGLKNNIVQNKEVKVKMLLCPCGNAFHVAIEHKMDTKSKNRFAKEAMKYNLQVKTISLEEYKTSKVEMYCSYDNCLIKTYGIK